jgi:hypothetical protein
MAGENRAKPVSAFLIVVQAMRMRTKKGALGGRSHVTAHIIQRLERSVHFANGKRKSWGILLIPWYSASSRFRRNGGRFVKKLALSTLACESQGEITAS